MANAAGSYDDWIPLPNVVAGLLGRLTFYAAWVEDALGEAVVLSNPDATHRAESTPDWESSGRRLVAAVRGIKVYPLVTEQLADRLNSLIEERNLLVHGVWMWRDEAVMVMKRSLSGGERYVECSTYSHDEIEDLTRHFQTLGRLAERFVAILNKNVHRPYEDRYRCPRDGTRLGGSVVDDLIVQLCPSCGFTASAAPT